MSAVTALTYQTWLAGLDEKDREKAIAAGLDAPPSDEFSQYGRGGVPLLEFDGLPTFHKNKSVHPLQHESTRDFSVEEADETDDTEVSSDLAAALRAVLAFVVRGMSPDQIISQARTVALRVYVVCRSIQLNDCHQKTMAEIADKAGVSRAALSKIGVELRDQFRNHHLHYGGREQARVAMRESARRAWKRRKG